ncbi:MAG: 50S ribosomal protein L25 [Planctomycetota bacterium]|jgi:large subunit ribosomal protein L25|nr:50S ribosomal protein L25 [Planctomycetota bacterium]MDP6762440.1 50S ribosomal protein L25 [Planctomycetota bacterium]MDP6989138.1 50S ribosomal protein L25 [Planctomycetota bacterium]
MSSSETLQGDPRTELGTRAARRLRSDGRIPANLQADDESPHVDFSVDEREFLATRRHHTHLYDIEVGGESASAVVRELQWDALGDRLHHIEFRRVKRGVKAEFSVPLVLTGHPKSGIATQLVDQVTILSIPSKIPDGVELIVNELDEGAHLTAADLILPEDVELAVPAETELAVIVAPKHIPEPTEGEEDDEATEPEIIGESKREEDAGDDGDEGGSSDS